MDIRELSSEELEMLWLMVSVNWEKIILIEGVHDCSSRAVFLLNCTVAFAVQLKKSTGGIGLRNGNHSDKAGLWSAQWGRGRAPLLLPEPHSLDHLSGQSSALSNWFSFLKLILHVWLTHGLDGGGTKHPCKLRWTTRLHGTTCHKTYSFLKHNDTSSQETVSFYDIDGLLPLHKIPAGRPYLSQLNPIQNFTPYFTYDQF